MQGVSADKILDDLLNNLMTKKSIGQEHLVQRQDILNLQKELNVHANDLIVHVPRLRNLVNRNMTQFYCRYKPQGTEQGDDMNDIGRDDFILVIQTERCYETFRK